MCCMALTPFFENTSAWGTELSSHDRTDHLSIHHCPTFAERMHNLTAAFQRGSSNTARFSRGTALRSVDFEVSGTPVSLKKKATATPLFACIPVHKWEPQCAKGAAIKGAPPYFVYGVAVLDDAALALLEDKDIVIHRKRCFSTQQQALEHARGLTAGQESLQMENHSRGHHHDVLSWKKVDALSLLRNILKPAPQAVLAPQP